MRGSQERPIPDFQEKLRMSRYCVLLFLLSAVSCYCSEPILAGDGADSNARRPAGEEQLRAWLSFYQGPDIRAEFKRLDCLSWRTAELVGPD